MQLLPQFASASDNGIQQVLCLARKARRAVALQLLSTLLLCFTPAQQVNPPNLTRRTAQTTSRKLWKGFPMSDSSEKSASGQAADSAGFKSPAKCSAFVTEVQSCSFQLFEPSTDCDPKNSGKSDASLALDTNQNGNVSFPESQSQLLGNTLQSDHTSAECLRGGDSTDESSRSEIAQKLSGDSTEVPVKSAVSALGCLLNPEKARVDRRIELQNDSPENIHNRIASRLVQLEAHEPEPDFRDSYRISWLTVTFCFTGEAVECSPHVLATYKVFGCHPDKVWPRTQQNRRALLGIEYEIDQLTPSVSPKKSSPVLIPEKTERKRA